MHLLKRLIAIGSVCIAALIKVEADDIVDLAELSLGELMNLEVFTPGKVPETIREAAASVYLFSRNDIEVQGYRNLTEVLENVPGFYNIDNYNGVSGNFGVRGFWNGRSQNSSVAILVNGIPQMRMDTRAHPMELIDIPVESIDRIEIARGPNSVIYGNGASFGVINIITDESYYDNQMSVSYGSKGEARGSARWSAFSEDGHLILNVGWSQSDGVDHSYRELISPENFPDLFAYGISNPEQGLDGRMEREMSHLQLSGEWQDLYFDFTYHESDVEHFTVVPPLAEGSLRNSINSRLMVGMEHAFSSNLLLDTKITYADYDMHQNFDTFSPDFVATNSLSYNSVEFESLLTYEVSEELLVIAGVNWQRMEDLYELTNIPLLGLNNEAVDIPHRETQALFTQFSYQITDTFRMVGGFRIEELRSFDRMGFTNVKLNTTSDFGGRIAGLNNFTPRASFIYQLDESNIFKLLAGDAVKLGGTTGSLRPVEKTRTFELNYIHSKENTVLSLSVFRNSLSGLQVEQLQVTSNDGVEGFSLVGDKVRTFGLEALLRHDFDEYWSGELGGTWQDSDNLTRPMRAVSYSPEFVGHGKLSYAKGSFSGALAGRYVDSMFPFYEVTNRQPLGPYIGNKSPAYFVADVNFRWNEVWENMYLSLRIENVFNEEIRYPNNPGNTILLDRGTIGAERGGFLTIGVDY